MRAIGVNQFGGPEVLEVVDLELPRPGPDEVRIRVHAAAVNPTDTGLRSGAYGSRLEGVRPPYIPGMDAAGVISEVGDGAPLRVGDEVIAITLPTSEHGGAYADEVVVPAAQVVALPAGADMAHGATLPMNGMTARLTLDLLGLRPGDTLAVTGAAGTYGGYVIQLAKHAGLTVLADAAPGDEELVRGFGADHVVARGDDVAERFGQIVPGGVDAVADGAVMNDLVAPAVRDGGGFATVRGWDGDPGRGITVHKVMVFGFAKEHDALEELRKLAESGVLTLRVARVLPAEQAAEAHRILEAGGVRGRIILDFS
jgi:NADPH2:quinone reductase